MTPVVCMYVLLMHPCNQHTHLYTLLRIQVIFSSARSAWHSRDGLQLPQYSKTLRNPTQQTTHSPISLIQSHDKLYIDLLWYTCGYRLEFVCKADCKTRQQSQVIWWALEYHDGMFREHQPIESRKIPVRRYLWIRHVNLGSCCSEWCWRVYRSLIDLRSSTETTCESKPGHDQLHRYSTRRSHSLDTQINT